LACIRIAAAASVFDDLHESLAGERLLQIDIEDSGNVALTDNVSSETLLAAVLEKIADDAHGHQ
jgi:hypothetical protein